MVAYIECGVRGCVALLLAAYSEYHLWYVPTEIIAFAQELGFVIEVPVGYSTNIRQVLDLLDIIEATDFTTLQEQCRDRQSLVIYYHTGRTIREGDCVFYDPCRGHKIDERSARMPADATRIISDDLECGWVHTMEDVEWTLHKDTRDYHPIYGRSRP